MFNVSIDTDGINQDEARAWTQELSNVFADVEIEDVSVSGNKISFKAGLAGMEGTSPDEIKGRLDEYLTMNEAFHVKASSEGRGITIDSIA